MLTCYTNQRIYFTFLSLFLLFPFTVFWFLQVLFSFQNRFETVVNLFLYFLFKTFFLSAHLHTYILSIYYILLCSVAITTQKLNQNCHKMCIYELILKLYFSTRDF